MRVILDTNILLSALISTEGSPAKLADAWLEGQYTLISHALQLQELRDITRREEIRRIIQPARAGRLVNQVLTMAEMPGKLPQVERSPDPRDDFLLALCEAGSVDWLVTGDKRDLLALKRHGSTRITTAAALAKELKLD
jgi:putative PIN family toxin of toxin-antitoxin system